MSYVDLILKKRNGQALDEEEIKEFVSGVKEGTMADYQITALLMAIYFQGLNRKELANLTSAMAQSGASLSFPELPGPTLTSKTRASEPSTSFLDMMEEAIKGSEFTVPLTSRRA